MNTPRVPSASSTANAQTASNVDTAKAQAKLNNVNQVTPYGNLNYTSTTGKDGIPQYTATQTLSPAQQQLLNTNQGTLQNLSNTGGQLANQIGTNLSSPMDFSQQQQYLQGLTNGNLDYNWDRQQGSLDQQLANKGLKIGDESYSNAQRDFSTDRSAAYNAANLNNFTTAQQSQSALRDQPINELTALLGQTQVQQPSFTGTPQTGVQGTDVAGITNTAYQNQNAQSNGFYSGLGSLASAAGGFLFSDKSLKTDIGETGMKTPDGIPMKTFRYRNSPMMQMGVIAQDVEKKRPDAVINTPKGKAVDYRKIGSPMLNLGAKRVA